ncbi:MAG TPA: cation transporter [Candidatus Marinimicrobia bacterium]|nr:cation transporter [Candidatus Neomarinimicrobiota bacterium]
MTDCCTDTACEINKFQARQSKMLKVVLSINLGMFLLEFVAGLMAASTALLADSLDMLGDALVYGFSLYVVSRNDTWKAVSAVIKSGIMALFGLFVLGQAAYKFLTPITPQFEMVGLIGLIALTANAVCLSLLWHHRAEDVNMRSVWLCSRNDIIANTSVLLAALGVWLTNSQWPDLLVGLGIAVLFLRSAFHVFQDAAATYSAHNKSLNKISGPRRSYPSS